MVKTLLIRNCAGSVNSAFIAQSCTMIPHNRFPEPVGKVSGIALLYSASAESLSYGASQGLLFILLWFAMGIHLCTINIVTLVFSETPI